MRNNTSLFEYYLAPISARVAISIHISYIFIMQNAIFENTLLRPNLYNIFFSNIHKLTQRNDATYRKFANDLIISNDFFQHTSNENIFSDM